MTAPWNIGGLLRDLALHDRHLAVIAFAAEGGSETWDSATVADKALRVARGLRDTGVGTGKRVALWAPNSPVWIVGALAVLSEPAMPGGRCPQRRIHLRQRSGRGLNSASIALSARMRFENGYDHSR